MHDTPRTTRLRAPGNYLQGPGVLDDAVDLLAALGDRAVVLGGDTALSAVESDLRRALEAAAVDVAAVERGVNASTADAVSRYADLVREASADVVVAVGGGKAIDAAKAAAERADRAVVTVPTVPSTNAPSSAVSVLYDDAGRVVEDVFRHRDPELVLVDTDVMAAAPARFLRYGMGDAFATRFEAEATARSGGGVDEAGRGPTLAGTAVARGVYANLAEYGPDALAAMRRNERTPALEAVVETVVVQSAVGFESGGLAAAHAFHQGFREVGVTDPHGIVVAFGTLAELVLEGHDELDAVLDTYLALDLDVTLGEMGVDDDAVPQVAAAACDRPLMANEPVDVTPDRAAAALRRANELVTGNRA